MIHPTAIIDSSAQLGENVKVGPWSQIGADVKIGDHCEIASHAVIKGPTIIGEKNKLLSENLEVTITFMEEKPISVDLPNNIECKIETTDAVVKGQTAASSYKPAKLDNGINITVPPFIESGEKIILDTRTLEYVKKVN
mgnify:CR=1 FL=1